MQSHFYHSHSVTFISCTIISFFHHSKQLVHQIKCFSRDHLIVSFGNFNYSIDDDFLIKLLSIN